MGGKYEFWWWGFCVVLVIGFAVEGLPVVDKGVFVITGVKTCRDGYGYCILGTDCTVDKEFINDDLDGHCDGLKKAFTPRAFFVCCQSLENSTISTTTTTTTTSSTTPSPPSLEEDDEDKSNESGPGSGSNEDSGSKASTSVESGEIPPIVLNSLGINVSTTDKTPGLVEEVQTMISVSENFNVIVGDILPKGEEEGDEGVTEGVSTTPSTTTTSTSTTTTTVAPPTTNAPVVNPFSSDSCGYKATFYSAAGVAGPSAAALVSAGGGGSGVRIDGSRLAAQQTSLVCWTGAIVRSPSSLTLQDPGSFICTGALISEDFLLTTATCVSRLFAQDLSLFKVALGSRHLVHPMNGPTPDAVYRDIVQLIVHEDYNIQGLFKRVNDIALVRLGKTGSMRNEDPGMKQRDSSSSQYCTVCLPDGEEDHSGEDCIVTGFSHPTGSAASIDDIVAGGGTLDAGNGVPSAHDTDGILHEADQRIEFATNCEVQLTNFTVAQNTLLRNDLNIEQSKLVCASGKYNMEACFSPRDAGSPLACASPSHPDKFKLIGVFSSGFHCGTTSSPVLYTDVSKFVGWVRSNVRRVVEGGSSRLVGR